MAIGVHFDGLYRSARWVSQVGDFDRIPEVYSRRYFRFYPDGMVLGLAFPHGFSFREITPVFKRKEWKNGLLRYMIKVDDSGTIHIALLPGPGDDYYYYGTGSPYFIRNDKLDRMDLYTDVQFRMDGEPSLLSYIFSSANLPRD